MITAEQREAANAEIDELVALAKEAIEQEPRSRLPLTILVGCTKDPITGAELLDMQKGRAGLAWIPVVWEDGDAGARELLYNARAVGVAGEAVLAIHFAMTTAVPIPTTEADVGKHGNAVAAEHGITTGEQVIAHPDARLVIVAALEEQHEDTVETRMWNLEIDQGHVDLDEAKTTGPGAVMPVVAGGSLPSILIDEVPPDNIRAQARRVAYQYLLAANAWGNEYDAQQQRGRASAGGDA